MPSHVGAPRQGGKVMGELAAHAAAAPGAGTATPSLLTPELRGMLDAAPAAADAAAAGVLASPCMFVVRGRPCPRASAARLDCRARAPPRGLAPSMLRSCARANRAPCAAQRSSCSRGLARGHVRARPALAAPPSAALRWPLMRLSQTWCCCAAGGATAAAAAGGHASRVAGARVIGQRRVRAGPPPRGARAHGLAAGRGHAGAPLLRHPPSRALGCVCVRHCTRAPRGRPGCHGRPAAQPCPLHAD